MINNSRINRSQGILQDEKLLRLLFDNTNEHAICIITNNGIIRTWNKSAEKLLGFSAENIIGKNYSILFSKEGIKKRLPKKLIAEASRKEISRSENVCVRKDNTFFWGSLCVTPIKNGSRPHNFVLIMQNISEKKEIERQKDEYIGIASHELKTPVAALSLYSELLADRLKTEHDKKTLQLFNDMKAQVSRMVNLIDDLLVVSEIERNKLSLNIKSFNINQLIRKVIHDFQTSTMTHNVIVDGKAKGNVSGDPNRITQVLVNLIANGIKYSPQANKILIKITNEKKKLIVSVQDFGQGITLREQRDIFRRYFRSYSLEKGNIPGLGLGLYISKKIIDNHGERIWVRSQRGRGSVFSFSLSYGAKR